MKAFLLFDRHSENATDCHQGSFLVITPCRSSGRISIIDINVIPASSSHCCNCDHSPVFGCISLPCLEASYYWYHLLLKQPSVSLIWKMRRITIKLSLIWKTRRTTIQLWHQNLKEKDVNCNCLK